MVPFVFGGNYNGPGQWRYGLGFVESGGSFGAEGSFAGYESATMHSPELQSPTSSRGAGRVGDYRAVLARG